MDRIKLKAIHVPSVLRLLRLMNANICERGVDCCALDIIKNKPCKLKNSIFEPLPFGLAICRACKDEMSTSMGRFPGTLTHPFNGWDSRYLDRIANSGRNALNAVYIEQSTTEKCGSLVLFKHVKRIEKTDLAGMDIEERKSKQISLLEDMLARVESNGITKKCCSLSKLYISAFDASMDEYDAHVQRKREVTTARVLKRKADKAARKQYLSELVLNKIKPLLGNVWHKDMALKGSWNRFGCYEFLYWPSQRVLGPLLSAPGSVTIKKIKEALESMNPIYITLHMSCILEYFDPHRFQLLDSQKDLSNHERAFLHSIINTKSLGDFLRITNKERYTSVWNSIVAEKVPAETFYLAFRDPEYIAKSFVDSVGTNKKTKALAKYIYWNTYFRVGNYSWIRSSFIRYRNHYNKCKTKFDTIIALIDMYKKQPATVAWLEEADLPPNVDPTISRIVSICIVHRKSN